MRRSDIFVSNYVGKDDLATPLKVTIEKVEFEDIKEDSGKTKQKAVVSFREEDDVKPLILNLTNFITIEEAYGEETDDWAGKVIILWHDKSVMMKGVRKGGTRIRIPSGNPGAAPAPAAAPPAAPAPVPERLEWADALSMAIEVGYSEAELKRVLKEKGLNGYSPTKDGDVARKIIQEIDDTIPF